MSSKREDCLPRKIGTVDISSVCPYGGEFLDGAHISIQVDSDIGIFGDKRDRRETTLFVNVYNDDYEECEDEGNVAEIRLNKEEVTKLRNLLNKALKSYDIVTKTKVGVYD